MKKLLFFFTFLLLITLQLSAQKTHHISGFVYDSLKKPVPNTLIFFDGQKQNMATNKSGFFKISTTKKPKVIMFMSPNNEIGNYNYKGENRIYYTFGDNTIKANNATSQKDNKSKNLGLRKREYRNIYDYLKGTVPGVVVYDDNTILIRGATSFNASTQPLFIVNDTPVSSIEDLNPSDVKNITVLKGPEAAQYGSRGANGVIIIKTL